MNYSNEEILQQLRLGEDSRWEFKQLEFSGDRLKGPRRDDLADEIAAFANARGGVLLCGVSDQGDLQGLERRQMEELERVVQEICRDLLRPPVQPELLRREPEAGKALLLVEIPKGYARHESPGGSYRRVGSSKRKMNSDEQLRLAQERAQARFRWFDEQPVPETGLGTLEEALWKPFVSEEGADDPEMALEKRGVLARDEHDVRRATAAGVLLCSTAPEQWLPGACITAACYRGKDRSTGQIDAQTITGPLGKQIAEAIGFAVRNMRVAAYKTPARRELPQYSEEALFEAVVNAAAHRDYSIRGSRIRLSLFEDRLEIQSPGALPNNLTVDDMPYRQSTRNELLTSLLGRTAASGIRGSGGRIFIVERRGDGVPIMRRKTRELSGRFPEFRLISDSELCVSIPAAPLSPGLAHAAITVRCAGKPLAGAELLVLFPNQTWQQATTGEQGEAGVDLHTLDLPMTVFAAARGCAAHLEKEWLPGRGALAVDLAPLPGGGAVIFPERTGAIPGIEGRLNPVRDSTDRTFLYTSNIAVNKGQQQPVHFIPGEELRLTDACGQEMLVRIVAIRGKASLLEYRALQPKDKHPDGSSASSPDSDPSGA